LTCAPLQKHLPQTTFPCGAIHTLRRFSLTDSRIASPRPLPPHCSTIRSSHLCCKQQVMFGPDGSQPRGFAPSTSPLHPFDVAAKPMPDSPLGLVPLQGSLQVVVVPTLPAEACCVAGTSTPSAVRRLLPLLLSSSSHRSPKCAVFTVPPDPAAHRSVLLRRAPFDQPLLNFHLLLAASPKCRCFHRPCSSETCRQPIGISSPLVRALSPFAPKCLRQLPRGMRRNTEVLHHRYRTEAL
jgi:hypothetical protein